MNGDNAWLLHEVPRVLREMPEEARPRAVAIENVKGLLEGEACPLHFEPLLEELDEAGYTAD